MTDREYAKMCVGAGWHSLVDEAFDYFEEQAVEVIQVKEKFGQLRIYVTSASDEMYVSENVYAKIAEIEGRSGRMCECCGQPAEQRTKGGWVKTICIPCEEINRVLASKGK
jgi:hypothetical protein